MRVQDIPRIHPAVAATMTGIQQQISREMGEVLNGLAALECLTDAAKNGKEPEIIADALGFVCEHMYSHVRTAIDFQDNMHATVIGAK